MDEFIEGIYLHELVAQCEYAVGSVNRMNQVLQNQGSPSEFFREASNFLQHSSAASRLLWPPGSGNRREKKRAKKRGKHLRTKVEIDDGEALKNRALRNHFEHFDERLDDWAETSPHKNIVDNMIGPRNAIAGDSVKDQDFMRLFDPATKRLIFRGEPFDVQALVTSLTNIQAKARQRITALEANRRMQRTPKTGAADAGR
jgi:hypothetical protein